MIFKNSVFVFLVFVTVPLFSEDAWVSFKNKTIFEMNSIPGWCSAEKALLMMDVVKEYKCQNCVEVGVFSGMSLFPIAKALQYNGSGKVTAIDAWDSFEAIKGFSPSNPNYVWWGQLDLNYFYMKTLRIINENKLNNFCTVIKQSSQNAACLFADDTIDFIHLDGNHNEEFALQDVVNYFPKVKDGGYILLNDPNWYSMKSSLVFLLERADLISPFSLSATHFLFRKSHQRMKIAEALLND